MEQTGPPATRRDCYRFKKRYHLRSRCCKACHIENCMTIVVSKHKKHYNLCCNLDIDGTDKGILIGFLDKTDESIVYYEN